MIILAQTIAIIPPHVRIQSQLEAAPQFEGSTKDKEYERVQRRAENRSKKDLGRTQVIHWSCMPFRRTYRQDVERKLQFGIDRSDTTSQAVWAIYRALREA